MLNVSFDESGDYGQWNMTLPTNYRTNLNNERWNRYNHLLIKYMCQANIFRLLRLSRKSERFREVQQVCAFLRTVLAVGQLPYTQHGQDVLAIHIQFVDSVGEKFVY